MRPETKLLAGLALLVSGVALPASSGAAVEGPSFDCTKATTKVERAICGSSDLALSDRQIARRYGDLLQRLEAASETAAALRADQRSFLAERDSCDAGGSDLDICLLGALQRRLSQLAVLEMGLFGPTLQDPPTLACMTTATSNVEMTACAATLLEAVDRALGLVNSAATERYLATDRQDAEEAFAESEALLERYRQSACELERLRFEGGTGGRFAELACLAGHGWRRLQEVADGDLYLRRHWSALLPFIVDQVNGCLRELDVTGAIIVDVTETPAGELVIDLQDPAGAVVRCRQEGAGFALESMDNNARDVMVVFEPLAGNASTAIDGCERRRWLEAAGADGEVLQGLVRIEDCL